MRARSLALTGVVAAAVVAAAAWLLSARDSPGVGAGAASGASPAGEAPPEPAKLQGAAPAKLQGAAPAAKAIVPTKDENPAAAPAKGDGDPTTAAAAAALVVRVTVGDAPREGATVRVRRKESLEPIHVAKTDAKGVVRFEGADRLHFLVEVFAEGMCAQCLSIDESTLAGQEPLDVTLEPGVAFGGRVLDAASGRGLPQASVVVTLDWTEFEFGPTDEQGRFHVPGAPDEQDATIVARAPGHVPGELTLRVEGGKVQGGEPVLKLASGGALTGVVVSADGKPVPGAVVRVVPQVDVVPEEPGTAALPSAETSDGEPYATSVDHFQYDFPEESDGAEVLHAVAGPGGAFRVEGLAFGTAYEATSEATGHAEATGVRDLRVTAEVPERAATLTLRRAALVLVRVTVPEGMALPPDPRVRLFPHGRLARPLGRDAEGRFRFEDVEPGPASAFVMAEGFRSVVRKIVVAEGRTAEVEIALEIGAGVEGVVTDVEGGPLAGVDVQIASASSNKGQESTRWLSDARKGKTDAQGRFSVGGIPPGPAVIVARWGDYGTREWVRCVAPAVGVRVVLSRLGSVRVRLLTPEGRPFEGQVAWEMMTEYGGGGSSGETAKAGVVEDSGLDDGEYTYLVVPKGYAWIVRPATIRDGAGVDLGDVTLDPGIAAIGRVVDGAGGPLAGVTVKCAALLLDERWTTTDAEGRFTLEHFPREPYTLKFHFEGLSDVSLTVDPQKMEPLDVRMTPPARIRGVMKEASGAMPTANMLELRRPGAKGVRRTYVRDGVTHEYTYSEGSEWLEFDETSHFDQAVPAGRWLVIWMDEKDKEHQIAEWTLTSGETREIEIVLPAK